MFVDYDGKVIKMAAPIQKFMEEGIETAVWQNTNKDGEKSYSVSIQKRYKNKEGQWTTARSYFEKDLQILSQQIVKAIAFLKDQDE